MRRSPLAAFLLGGLGLAAQLSAAHASNVLLIVMDDVGIDKLGVYQSAVYGSYTPTYMPSTPGLDALANAGLRFTNVYASPVCSPTRAGVLTGRYPYQTDVSKTVSSTSAELSSSETTLAEILSNASYVANPYDVGLFGKWHLGTTSAGGTDWSVAGEYADIPNPATQGFSTYQGGLEGQPEDYYDWLYVQYPQLLSSGATGTTVDWDTDYAGAQPLDDAYSWITSRTDNWMAVVTLNVAHTDTAESESDYEENDLPPSVTCPDMDGDGACSNPEIYGALVEYADSSITQFLTDLQTANRATLEDTLIVIIGDNGSPAEAIEAPFTPSGERTDGGKNTTYESGVLVPLLITRGCDWMDISDGTDDNRYGGSTRACSGTSLRVRTPGLAISARTLTQDLFATINGVAGSTYAAPSSSVNLSSCLTATSSTATNCSNATLTSRRQYTETFRRDWSATTNWATTGVAAAGTFGAKRGNYKLVGRLQGSGSSLCLKYEFYDLSTDPYETNNLRVGGDVMTSAQNTAYSDLKSYVKTTLAPDWLPSTICR